MELLSALGSPVEALPKANGINQDWSRNLQLGVLAGKGFRETQEKLKVKSSRHSIYLASYNSSRCLSIFERIDSKNYTKNDRYQA